MKFVAFTVLCILAFSSQLYSVPATIDEPSVAIVHGESNHGGKIDSKYDGLNHETVSTLRKMKVTCAGGKNMFKDACVSLSASLHSPGIQLNYVRYARLQLIFETKQWDLRHALDERDLVVVVDATTFRLGRMRLVSQDLDTQMTEILEATISYDVFKKIVSGQSVEIVVGKSGFELREKNLEALRDLNNRVKISN
ncbi:MAG: hypothetical protein ACR2H6_02825 [Pyrinomonadaceae bacterium]